MKTESHIPTAVYGDPELPEYKENPLIAALPPIYDEVAITKKLRMLPSIASEEINLEGRIRVHAIARLLSQFFQPLSHHLQLENKISLMIRQGYLGRSPKTADFNKHLQNAYERTVRGDLDAFVFVDVKSTATDMSLFGCSGCGKTKTVERILSTYPQVIRHSTYNITQIVYLKLDCPPDGDLDELCLSFFSAVDVLLKSRYSHTHGKKRLGTPRLLANMCQVACLHAIGLLVIDEVQNLSEARSGGSRKMQNFFVSLVNNIGVPVMQIGTFKARRLFQGSFRGARRVTGIGSLFWDRVPNNKVWHNLVKVLWRYQWLQKATPLTNEIEVRLYELSQGVMDIVAKLFVLAQARAIAIKLEMITPDLLTAVYEDELKPVHPMLEALKSNDPAKIAKFDDLVMPDIEVRLLSIVDSIEAPLDHKFDKEPSFSCNKHKKLLSLLEQMDIAGDVAEPLIDEILLLNPELPIPTLIHKLTLHSVSEQSKQKPKQQIAVKRADWSELESDDLRHTYSVYGPEGTYKQLKGRGVIFDLTGFLSNSI